MRFLCGVGVYSRAMTTLPSMDGGGAPPEGRVGGVLGGSAAIVVRGWLVWQPARRRASVLPAYLSGCPFLGSVSASFATGATVPLPVARHTSVDQPVTPSVRRQSTEPSRFPQGPGDKEWHPQRSPRPRTGSRTSATARLTAYREGQPRSLGRGTPQPRGRHHQTKYGRHGQDQGDEGPGGALRARTYPRLAISAPKLGRDLRAIPSTVVRE